MLWRNVPRLRFFYVRAVPFTRCKLHLFACVFTSVGVYQHRDPVPPTPVTSAGSGGDKRLRQGRAVGARADHDARDARAPTQREPEPAPARRNPGGGGDAPTGSARRGTGG